MLLIPTVQFIVSTETDTSTFQIVFIVTSKQNHCFQLILHKGEILILEYNYAFIARSIVTVIHRIMAVFTTAPLSLNLDIIK